MSKFHFVNVKRDVFSVRYKLNILTLLKGTSASRGQYATGNSGVFIKIDHENFLSIFFIFILLCFFLYQLQR
jgi:hypothetical protein